MRAFIVVLALPTAWALSGCTSPPRWSSGNYEVYSMGGPDELKLGVDVGGGMQALVMPHVVAVGEDSRWIVVKRHPDRDRMKTECFYLQKRSDEEQRKGSDSAQGPFSEKEFEVKTEELKLPSCSLFF